MLLNSFSIALIILLSTALLFCRTPMNGVIGESTPIRILTLSSLFPTFIFSWSFFKVYYLCTCIGHTWESIYI
jgi:hypothetical protein